MHSALSSKDSLYIHMHEHTWVHMQLNIGINFGKCSFIAHSSWLDDINVYVCVINIYHILPYTRYTCCICNQHTCHYLVATCLTSSGIGERNTRMWIYRKLVREMLGMQKENRKGGEEVGVMKSGRRVNIFEECYMNIWQCHNETLYSVQLMWKRKEGQME